MKKFLIIAIPIILIATAVAVFFFKKSRFEEVAPKKGPIVEAIYGLGKVKTNRRYDLKLGVPSTVLKVFVEEGDVVKAGAPLIKFDTGSVFKAPFDGVVTAIQAFAGETVPPQASVLTEENLDDVYIEVSLEQEAALRVRPDQKVKVVFESLRNNVFQGHVQSIYPKNDEFLAHIESEQLDRSILPGMTADVSIEIGQIDEALLIPFSAISNGMVTVRRQGKKIKIPVKVGHVDGQWAEVTDDSVQLSDKILVPKKAP